MTLTDIGTWFFANAKTEKNFFFYLFIFLSKCIRVHCLCTYYSFHFDRLQTNSSELSELSPVRLRLKRTVSCAWIRRRKKWKSKEKKHVEAIHQIEGTVKIPEIFFLFNLIKVLFVFFISFISCIHLLANQFVKQNK